MFRDAKVGDKVWRPVKDNPEGEWGEITGIDEMSLYPIRAFGQGFTWDGYFYHSVQIPSIFWGPVQLPQLPTRPKRKVKKTVEGWVNVYPDDDPCFHLTREGADRGQFRTTKRIACVHLTGEYEVEE